MYDDCTIDSYATIVDERGRFVDSIGRVISIGDVLTLKDGTGTDHYRKQFLFDAVTRSGLKLMFIPPSLRLPKAPDRMLKDLYGRIAETRVDA
jgi:hypothetical protein